MSLNWKELNKRMTIHAIQNGIPLSGAFELTSRCNFKCKMCYVASPINDRGAKRAELSAEKWIDMGRQARDAGLFYLILTGGEVFLRSDFEKIYEALCEMGLNITIYSNASMITPQRAKWLGRIPPAKLSVTVYGTSPKTYERITGYADGYMRTLRALDCLKAENVRLEIKTTVVEGNFREYKEMFKIAHTYSDTLGVVNYISPRREGCGSDPMGNRLTPAQIVNYEKVVNEYGAEHYPRENKVQVKLEDSDHDNPVVLQNTSAFRCQAGKTGFWITWDGRMIPCGLLDTPVAYPFKEGFSEAWSQLKAECLKVPSCKDCAECSIRDKCMSCPGRLMSETGSFDKPARYLCDSAKCREAVSQLEKESAI